MAEHTGIAWCDHTFNPWWGCTPVSTGCDNCYAHDMALRVGRDCWGASPRQKTKPQNWQEPIKWNQWAEEVEERRLVFCGSMMDWAEDYHSANVFWRSELFDLIRATPHLTWLMLTKRAARIPLCLPDDWGEGYKNVWLGVTAENQEMADLRIPILLNVPAVQKFISAEPLLGPIEFRKVPGFNRVGLSLHDWWIIVGGESGPNCRPMDLNWARYIREQCETANIPFFFKQTGGVKGGSHILDGEKIYQFPILD